MITGNFRLKISDLILFDFLATYFETTRINISIFHALNLLHSRSDIKKQLKTGKSKALIKKFEPVKEVEYIQNFKLRVIFDNSVKKMVDLENYLDGEIFEPLKNIEYFKQVKVDKDRATSCWDNGADFSPEFLYEIGE
mgnify:CR=1 FL=1